MTEFKTNSYVLVKGFLDPQTVDTLSRYLENSLNRYPENVQKSSSSDIGWYADPLTEVVLKNCVADVETVTGLSLDPTYSFTRVYKKGEVLRPHVDRLACEISVTCHIATKGEPWPIYMKALGKEPVAHYFEPGDACIYRGCEVAHWREATENTDFNVQMMLHYVDKNGPNAKYKFDERPNLGLNNFSRRS